ncbi:Endonuclease/exonuclease/phosphatase [Lyophyllum atratum]|nr:Endonuclease/exonuclease/phosphatase [Lyophyllum atratum]
MAGLYKAAQRQFVGSMAMPTSEPPRLPSTFFGALYTYDADANIWASHHNQSTPIPAESPLHLRLLTWNVEFDKPRPNKRLHTVLSHLSSHLSSPPGPPTIILLQELLDTCFPALLAHPFVRAHYALTDVSPDSWTSDVGYGTVTLVPRALAPRVKAVFRTPLPDTRMGRDALYVDIALPPKVPDEIHPHPDTRLRIANVHLESLSGPSERARALQLSSVTLFLREDGVSAGIVAGDMSAISQADRGLPERVGLVDAWKVRSGKVRGGDGGGGNGEGEKWEDGEEDYTWGYQPRCRFRPARLDKVLFVGGVGVERVERVGVGLKVDEGVPTYVEEEEEGEYEDEVMKDPWASDHYGLLATLVVGA